MKRLITTAVAALVSLAASAATLTPIQILNPAGSTSGQAIVSTGASSAPTWSNVTASGLTPVSSNTVIANATASSASPTALAMPGCSGTNNALLWVTSTGFTCGSGYALATGNLSQFASTTSAQLAGVLSDETGTGAAVFSGSPALTGTPTAPTAAGNTNTTQVATTAFVEGEFATPPAAGFGSTTARPVSATTLAVSSTVSGTGFSTYLASPPAIGGTSPNTGAFTTLSATTGSATTAATFTTSSSGSTLKIVDTGTSGANFAMFGNGGSTPNKFLRALNGSFGIVNSAYTTQVLTLSDGGNLSVTGSIAPSTTAGIVGTATNDSANAGAVGEVICAQVTNGGSPSGCATNNNAPVSLSSNVPANITSVSLTAGDWNCWGNVAFTNGGTTVTTQSTGSINTTSATMNTLQFANSSPPATAGLNIAFAVPMVRQLLASTTTVYLVANNVFATSTSAAYGRIDCRRMR